MPDKFAPSTVWVSHTSLSDFVKCPRGYFLKNVYKDPQTNRKMQVTSPALALGQAVHEVIDSLSVLPTTDRLREPLLTKFERVWLKVTGKKGGFMDPKTESDYKRRGEAMLSRLQQHPGPITKPAVKIAEELPQFWLSESESIRLCGKIDWLEYLPETDSVHIIDFKTSRGQEDPNSLQLPIYYLLVHYCQKRTVTQASYWYLEQSDELTPKELPDLAEAQEAVLSLAKQLKLARQLDRFKCPQGEGGCFACKPYEAVLRGGAEHVGQNDFRQDVYVLTSHDNREESVIL